ncbi:hypothetical protein ColTof4_03505 [Colletotrichum tofieldiae]|nr:hypothetical protein ColTof3_13068 [Colletotrichum tofieldiae]GKT71082.1 hypothetical protein ColTof4_03505 [Colletotrichum tofieldiae]
MGFPIVQAAWYATSLNNQPAGSVNDALEKIEEVQCVHQSPPLKPCEMIVLPGRLVPVRRSVPYTIFRHAIQRLLR